MRHSADKLLQQYHDEQFLQGLSSILDPRNQVQFNRIMKSLFDVRKKGDSMLNNVCMTEFDLMEFLGISKGISGIQSLPKNFYRLNK